MKIKFANSQLLFLLCISCNPNEDVIPEAPDWKIISTNSEIDIKGMKETDGEISIFGTNPFFHQDIEYFDFQYNDNCLSFSNFDETSIEDSRIPIYLTLDSESQSWHINETFKSNITDVQFLNENLGFLQTKLEGLFKTRDGGKTWTQILQGSVNHYCYGVASLKFDEINFKNEQEGYVVDVRNGGYILKTVDGGENWEMYPPIDGQPRKWLVYDIYFIPNSQVGYWKDGLYGGYRKTIDGGISWIDSITESGADDIAFLNSQVGFYIDQLIIYKTVDGGETWKQVTPENQIPRLGRIRELRGIVHLHPVNESIIFAGSEGIDARYIYRSENGGETFEIVDTPFEMNSISGFYSNEAGEVFAYGKDGLLMEYVGE